MPVCNFDYAWPVPRAAPVAAPSDVLDVEKTVASPVEDVDLSAFGEIAADPCAERPRSDADSRRRWAALFRQTALEHGAVPASDSALDPTIDVARDDDLATRPRQLDQHNDALIQLDDLPGDPPRADSLIPMTDDMRRAITPGHSSSASLFAEAALPMLARSDDGNVASQLDRCPTQPHADVVETSEEWHVGALSHTRQ